MDSRQLSVLKTLSYSDVFNFPLTFSEIYYFLHSGSTMSLSELKKTLAEMSKNKSVHLVESDGYFSFSDKKVVILQRLLSNEITKRKIIFARKIAQILMHIPSVAFIGISGGVAGGGASETDDIDLFIISQKGTLYTTRLLLLLLLQLMGRRRKRNQGDVKDMICLNMLIDESSILLSKDRQNLYTAREVAQLIPLFQRSGMYSNFLEVNKWTRLFLPNAEGKSGCIAIGKGLFLSGLFKRVEPISRMIQYIIIKRHSTSEVVGEAFLAFHPNDMRNYVLTEYQKRLRHYIKCYSS